MTSLGADHAMMSFDRRERAAFYLGAELADLVQRVQHLELQFDVFTGLRADDPRAQVSEP